MSVSETIYELVKRLPEEKANMVLMFAQFIHQHQEQPLDTSPTAETDVTPAS